jgi:hypothetical protein
MASVTVTITAGSETGAILRRLAKQIDKMAATVPDRVSTGASTVLTIDNAPSTGVVSVQLTAGPYAGSAFLV